MDKEKIGEFLKELRISSGLTQKEAGDLLGISDKSISRWERGQNLPDLDTLAKVARVYGVSLAEIVAGERNAPYSPGYKTEEPRTFSQVMFSVFSVIFVAGVIYSFVYYFSEIYTFPTGPLLYVWAGIVTFRGAASLLLKVYGEKIDKALADMAKGRNKNR